jgi:hypothetical protein
MAIESGPGPRDVLLGALVALEQLWHAGAVDRVPAVLTHLTGGAAEAVTASVAHDAVANLGYGFSPADLRGLTALCEAVTSVDGDPTLAGLLDDATFDRLWALLDVLDGGPQPWADGAGDAAYQADRRLREARLDVTVAHPAQSRHLLVGVLPHRSGAGPARAAGGAAAESWRTVTSAARAALSTARVPVTQLLDELEFATGPEAVRYALLGCLPPTTVDDPTVTLPAALRMLGDAVGLDRPRVVAAGAWGGTGFVPMAEAEATGRLAAVRADGWNSALLVPVAGGWRLLGLDGDVRSVPDPTLGLEGAARALWGDAWARWVGDRRRELLAQRACYLHDWTRPVQEPVPEVEVSQTSEILSVLRERSIATVVLGGPPSTGKTVIAGQVARRLTAKAGGASGWTVAMVSMGTIRLPEIDELVTLGRHALALAGPRAAHRLLVLDDLLPVGEGDVDRILPEVAEQLDASVLAVLRYETHSLGEWSTDTVAVVTLSTRPESVRQLATRMVGHSPALAGVDESTVRELADRYHHDLRTLTEALRDAANGRSVQQAEAELRRRFGELGDAERDQVATLAARSMLRSETHENHLAGLGRQKLTSFGATRGHGPDQWRIESELHCRQILREYGRIDLPDLHDEKSVDPVWIELAGRALVNALRVADPSGRDVLSLVRGARLASDKVCDGVIGEAKRLGAFTGWLSNVEAPERAALLRLGDSALGDDLLPSLLRQFADTLPDSPRSITPAGLADVLHVLSRRRDLIEDDAFDRCAGWIAEAFAAQLDGAIGPRNRSDLFRIQYRMLRLHHEVTNAVIRERGSEILRGLSPNRVLDYITVRRIDKITRQATVEGGYAPPVDEEPEVQELLDHVPSPASGVALQLAWLTLRMHFGREDNDWRVVIGGHQERILRSMRSSKARELRLALAELYDYNPQFCTKLMNEFEHFESGVQQMLRTDILPTEAADLLNTLLRIHGMTAFHIISDRDGSAHRGIAQILARRVSEARDGKGAGMLLSATQAIDDQYRFEGTPFAQLLADFLRRDWVLDQVAGDHPPSIKFYLVRGIWRAGVDYRAEVMEAAVDTVASEINKCLRPWGPQLALLLGEDRELGAVAMQELRGRVSHQRLLHAMVNAPTPDAQVHFHRLGRVMYPELPHEYLRQFDPENLNQRILASSPDATAQWCQASALTLTLAGLPDAGRTVLDLVDRRMGGVGWGKRLRRTATPGQTASVLRLLGRLDPQRAGEVLADVSLPTPAGGSRRDTSLERQVGFAMFNNQVDAADLMAAVEKVRSGAGRQLLSTVSEQSHRWKVFTTELEHLQDPSSLFIAVRHLARLGMLPGRPYSYWTERVFAHWSRTAHLIAGPRRMADLLRIFLLWGRESWSRTIAAEVSVDRLAGRLRYARRDDLLAVPRLIDALDLADRRDGARQVVEAVGRIGAAELVAVTGLDISYDLPVAVLRHDPRLADELIRASVRELPAELTRSVVLDELRRWTTIGWVGWLARSRGIDVPLPRDRTVTVNLALPYHSAWAVANLPSNVPWVRVAQRESADKLAGREPRTPTELFFALATVAAGGLPLDRVLPAEEDRVDRLLRGVSPPRVSALQSMATRHAGLRELLVAHRDTLCDALLEPEARLSVHSARIRGWFPAAVSVALPDAG